MPLVVALADSSVISGVSDVLSVASQAVTFLVGNPLCLFFIGVSVLGSGFAIFRKAKGASSGK